MLIPVRETFSFTICEWRMGGGEESVMRGEGGESSCRSRGGGGDNSLGDFTVHEKGGKEDGWGQEEGKHGMVMQDRAASALLPRSEIVVVVVRRIRVLIGSVAIVRVKVRLPGLFQQQPPKK